MSTLAATTWATVSNPAARRTNAVLPFEHGVYHAAGVGDPVAYRGHVALVAQAAGDPRLGLAVAGHEDVDAAVLNRDAARLEAVGLVLFECCCEVSAPAEAGQRGRAGKQGDSSGRTERKLCGA